MFLIFFWVPFWSFSVNRTKAAGQDCSKSFQTCCSRRGKAQEECWTAGHTELLCLLLTDSHYSHFTESKEIVVFF